MKKLPIALATQDLPATIDDYSVRLGTALCSVVPGEYALWPGADYHPDD